MTGSRYDRDPDADPDAVMLKRREHAVPFRTALALTADTLAQINDPRQPVDLRDRTAYPRAVVVQRKL